MNQPDPKSLLMRIDTVLDILVSGDTRSAIHNLEILKADLIASRQELDALCDRVSPPNPWEI